MSDERIAAFRKLLEAEPGDPLLRYGLGLELLKAGRAPEAAAEFAEAARLSPDHTAAYREWGKALERAGRPGEAREAWRRGVEVSRRTGDLQTRKEMEVFLRRLEEGATRG
jgi:Flp pilus assembly protein TadD